MSEAPPRIRTVIVDDEEPARRIIEQLLAHDDEIEVCSSVCDGREALAAFDVWKPDLVFLDIQMPGMSGFDVLGESLRRHRGVALPGIVFVTAFDEFAVRAFEIHAIDYLLKPFSDARFYRAVAHAKQNIARGADRKQLEQLLSEHGRRGGASSDRFIVRTRGHEVVLDCSEILWFEAADHYVLVHTAEESHIYRDTLRRLKESLDPDRFVRAHRGAIVSLEHITELRSAAGSECGLTLSNGVTVAVSRRRIREIRARLGS